MNAIELLEEILRFLNAVPNRKYGDNYLLASQLEELLVTKKINLLKTGQELSEIINQDGDNVSDGEVIDQIVKYLIDKDIYTNRK
jgi:hypothetical protein